MIKIPVEIHKLRQLFSRGEKLRLVILFLMMMVAALLEVAGIGLVPAFVAIVSNPERVLQHGTWGPLLQWAGITDSRDLLMYGAIALVAVFIVKNIYILGYRYLEARFISNRRLEFSSRLMTAYMQAPYTFYLGRNSAELLRNITGEVGLMINNVLGPLLKVVKEAIMTLGVLLFLFLIEPLITLFVILVMGGVAGLFLFVTQRKMKHYGMEAQGYRRDMIKLAREGFGGIKDVRVLNREAHIAKNFRVLAQRATRLNRLNRFISEIPRPLIETVAVTGVMAIALIMHLQGRPVSDIIPVTALFGIATIRLMPAMERSTKMLTDLRYNLASVNPVYDDLTELKEYQEAFRSDRDKKEKMVLRDRIAIRDLHYRYPGNGDQALRGVSIDIPHGAAVGFVGPSGSGKTTIVDVLLGLLEPLQGEVTVDGKPVFESISAWQRNIGYIPQFIYLADDTLRRNIAFGLPDAEIDDAKILRAAGLAQLDALIERLPQNVDTRIGERGTRLSGGERQRIGIARALYHEPQVLVMDEATSALDNITEQQVIGAIEKLKGERTIIMIAHRLTTVMKCDTLFMMDNGTITDQGTYEELLKRNPTFREMAMEHKSDKWM